MKKTKIMLIVFAVICLSSVLYKCGFSHSDIPKVYFNIQGNVTEAKDGAPIDGAQVEIKNLGSSFCAQTTGSNGDFHIGNCLISAAVKGFTNLYVYKNGYASQYVLLEITSSLQTINFALARETQ